MPGSRVSTGTLTSRERELTALPTVHSTSLHRAKMPVVVTVSLRDFAARSVMGWV